MRKTHKGVFVPKNPEKYMGTKEITFRSSWELAACRYFDTQPYVIAWSSESVSIPYKNPLKPQGRQQSMYIPDFLIVYQDMKGRKHVEMIEIKPFKEVPGVGAGGKRSRMDQLSQTVNAAKWIAAKIYCAKRGIHFRIITEKDLFVFERKDK